jgi:hypothetical protein
VPSASPRTTLRLVVAAVCGALLLGSLGGCATTQDTAKAKKAESEQILKTREAKRAAKKHDKKKGGEKK